MNLSFLAVPLLWLSAVASAEPAAPGAAADAPPVVPALAAPAEEASPQPPLPPSQPAAPAPAPDGPVHSPSASPGAAVPSAAPLEPPAPPAALLPPSVPMLEGTLVAAPPERPRPPHRPWWDLGVSERTYRLVMPRGPGNGTLDPAQTATFWQNYSALRRESLVVDAAEMAVLVLPLGVALVLTAAVPFTGLPAIADQLDLRGTPTERLVQAIFTGMPVAALAAFAVAAVCGLVFASLTSFDVQDIGAPEGLAKVTPAGARAVARGERGRWEQLALGLAVGVTSVALGALVLVTPWVLPFVLAPAVGASPVGVVQAYRSVAFRTGALGVYSAVGSHIALAGVMTLVPMVMVAGYVAAALPGVVEGDKAAGSMDEAEPGDDRDLTSVLNPLRLLFPEKKPDRAQPAPKKD